jgi:hypothetical protein
MENRMVNKMKKQYETFRRYVILNGRYIVLGLISPIVYYLIKISMQIWSHIGGSSLFIVGNEIILVILSLTSPLFSIVYYNWHIIVYPLFLWSLASFFKKSLKHIFYSTSSLILGIYLIFLCPKGESLSFYASSFVCQISKIFQLSSVPALEERAIAREWQRPKQVVQCNAYQARAIYNFLDNDRGPSIIAHNHLCETLSLPMATDEIGEISCSTKVINNKEILLLNFADHPDIAFSIDQSKYPYWDISIDCNDIVAAVSAVSSNDLLPGEKLIEYKKLLIFALAKVPLSCARLLLIMPDNITYWYLNAFTLDLMGFLTILSCRHHDNLAQHVLGLLIDPSPAHFNSSLIQSLNERRALGMKLGIAHNNLFHSKNNIDKLLKSNIVGADIIVSNYRDDILYQHYENSSVGKSIALKYQVHSSQIEKYFAKEFKEFSILEAPGIKLGDGSIQYIDGRLLEYSTKNKNNPFSLARMQEFSEIARSLLDNVAYFCTNAFGKSILPMRSSALQLRPVYINNNGEKSVVGWYDWAGRGESSPKANGWVNTGLGGSTADLWRFPHGLSSILHHCYAFSLHFFCLYSMVQNVFASPGCILGSIGFRVYVGMTPPTQPGIITKNLEAIQDTCGYMLQSIIADISMSRNIDENIISQYLGIMFGAQEALNVGFIDKVLPLSSYLSGFDSIMYTPASAPISFLFRKVNN